MMQNSLIQKLNKFNPLRPYIWELKVTENEFCSLEQDLCGCILNASNKDDALKMIVYIAEWYKRRYTNRAKKDYQKTFGGKMPDLKTAWNTLGIDERYLYQGEGGQKLYLYSTFIFSGLAIKFELQKNEKPFLKSLCRVLNGEDDSFENIVDACHSIAFRESVKQRHCLGVYLETIVNNIDTPDKLPFAKEDYDDAETSIKELTKLIKEINDAVKKSKFRLEWVVNAPFGDDLIIRSLHLWLNPDNRDASKRHLFKYKDIEERWGVQNPGDQHYIRIGLRYLQKKKGIQEPIVVQDADIKHPVLMFRNTGSKEVGFIASEPDYAVVCRVPVTYFNLVKIVCWDDDGNEYPIVEEEVNFDAVQLYRIDKFEDFWTSRSLPKRETVVLFSDHYTVAEDSDDKDFCSKTFYNKLYGEGIKVNWCPISRVLILQDEGGKRLDPFVNKRGENWIAIHLYENTIQYMPEGKVVWRQWDLDTDEETTDFVSLVTKKEDILAYFTEEGEEGDEPTVEAVVPDSIQFKGENGRYIDWNDDNVPPYGINFIRVYARQQLVNKDERFAVFFIPGGIVRDCDNNTVSFYDGKEQMEYSERDEIQRCYGNKQVLMPTKQYTIKISETDFVDIPVFRPAKLKEVIYDGKILMYDENGRVSIPYILKEYIDVNEYGDSGYRTYSCKNFRSVFVELQKNNLTSQKYHDIDGAKYNDDNAPFGVSFFIKEKFSKNSNLRYLYWNCKKGTQPLRVKDISLFTLPAGYVMFQDQRQITAQMRCESIEKEANSNNPFARAKKQVQSMEISIVEVFKAAVEYNLYFFIFDALRKLAYGYKDGTRDFYKELFEPLKESENGILNIKFHKALLRFTDEFCLDELKNQLIKRFINIQ